MRDSIPQSTNNIAGASTRTETSLKSLQLQIWIASFSSRGFILFKFLFKKLSVLVLHSLIHKAVPPHFRRQRQCISQATASVPCRQFLEIF